MWASITSKYSLPPSRWMVIQQALHRQPSTAAQYLQQMYAAQQQHLMLQTAALQQQHLSSAQLQSLAAVQQASIVAGRQSVTQNGSAPQRAGSSQTTINLATSPAAAQLMSRAQGVSPAPTGISQQAVLLGNAPSPALTASQAQMYLRAQMLIFTPTATVTTVHPEASSLPAGQQSSSAQVQNLAIRSQQGASSASPSQAQLQALGLKQASGAMQNSLSVQPAAQLKNPSLGAQGLGGKGSTHESITEGGKKAEGPSELALRGVAVSRNVTAVSSHALLTPAFAQIQPHQLLQQHKQPQFVIQSQPHQRSPAQAHLQAQAVQALALQPAVAAPPQGPVPVLPKPPLPALQAAVFHSTVGTQALAQSSQTPTVSPASQPTAQPVQLTAVNLQTLPVPSPAVQPKQDDSSKEQLAAPEPRAQIPTTPPQPLETTTEQNRPEPNGPALQAEGTAAGDRVNAHPGVGSPLAMTSGNGSNAPSVTGSTPQNAENKPPQAIVKPQILTHLIEGFVIQEGAEPFPVERPSLLIENLKKQKQQSQPDLDNQQEALLSEAPGSPDCNMETLPQQELKEQEDEATLKCELCGLVDFAYKFKRSKRFCSTLCAKRYNVGCTKRMGLFHPDKRKTEKHKKRRSRSSSLQSLSSEAKKQAPAPPQPSLVGSVTSPVPPQPGQGESSPCSDISSYGEAPSPLSAASLGPPRPAAERAQDQGASHGRELPFLMQHFLPSDPTKWNVEEVYTFIHSLPGCQEIAEEFRSQEIDGQALLLLKEDHLMSTMNIKLGPALKIYARISMLKDF
uniref:Polyhomeotic homolog 2a (Drosophila) n=1 Tax=Paramormyrops kingsleyae TaxID=1676925 RepID=A0A3B3SDH6_9TELE